MASPNRNRFNAHNIVNVDCARCVAIYEEHGVAVTHRHSEDEYRVASRTRKRFFHKTTWDAQRRRWYCSCEGGQGYDWALRRGERISECYHVRVAQKMRERGWTVWPGTAWATGLEDVSGEGDELFDDEPEVIVEYDEPAVVASAPAKKKPQLEDLYEVA